MHLAECPGLRPNDAPAGQGCVVEKPDPEGALDPGNGQAGDQRTELWVLVPGGKSEQSGQGVGWHLRLSSKPTPVSDLAALMPGAELDQLRTDRGSAVRRGATTASTDRGLPQHDFGGVVVAGHQNLFDYALQRPGGYGREFGRRLRCSGSRDRADGNAALLQRVGELRCRLLGRVSGTRTDGSPGVAFVNPEGRDSAHLIAVPVWPQRVPGWPAEERCVIAQSHFADLALLKGSRSAPSKITDRGAPSVVFRAGLGGQIGITTADQDDLTCLGTHHRRFEPVVGPQDRQDGRTGQQLHGGRGYPGRTGTVAEEHLAAAYIDHRTRVGAVGVLDPDGRDLGRQGRGIRGLAGCGWRKHGGRQLRRWSGGG